MNIIEINSILAHHSHGILEEYLFFFLILTYVIFLVYVLINLYI